MLRREQLAQHGVFAEAVEFLIDDLRGFGLDAVVVLFDRFLHAIRAVLVREIGDYGYLLVAGRLGLDLLGGEGHALVPEGPAQGVVVADALLRRQVIKAAMLPFANEN